MIGVVILENNYLKIKTVSLGAELKSIEDRDGVEYLLNDSKYWKFTSPHLFPTIGALKNQRFTYQGKTYSLAKHGFARTMEFALIHQENNQVIYELQSTEETFGMYPFSFVLQVKYLLDGKRITVEYTVKNLGDNEMVYSLGAHPAFLAPRSKRQEFTDYYLEFQEFEDLESMALNLNNGLLQRNTLPIGNRVKILELNKGLFTIDTLLFKNLKSNFVSLKNRKDNREVKMNISEFPFLGIWTTLGPSPFICIEPWIGHPDFEDERGDFSTKEDAHHLKSQEERVYSYFMDIL